MDIFKMKTHCTKHNYMSQENECQFCVKEERDALKALAAKMAEALKDCKGGLAYIRSSYGDLYGVGWDRALTKADEALRAYAEAQGEKAAPIFQRSSGLTTQLTGPTAALTLRNHNTRAVGSG